MINWEKVGFNFGRLLKLLWWPAVIIVAAIILTNNNLISVVNSDRAQAYTGILAWPVVAIVILLVLRPYIPGIIARVREFGVGGSHVKLDPSVPQYPSTATQDLNDIDEDVSEAATTGPADEPTNENLDELLTSAEARLAYEQVYRKIFGTQLKVLKRLRVYSNGLNVEQLQDLFEEHKQVAGNLAYKNMEAYLHFLLENILIIYDPLDRAYKLTNAGLYFLNYLDAQGITGNDRAF